MSNWSSFENNGGAIPWNNNGNMGGTALAAGAGALIGGLLFGNGGLGSGVNVEKSVGDLAASIPAQTAALQHDLFASSLAAADRSYQQTIAFGQQASTVDRDVLTVGYDTSRQMCDGFNASNVVALQNKYDYALQLAGLGYAQEKCCCETNQNIMKMGYETQLRDACYKNDTDKQFAEIKCLIENTSKDAIIRELTAKTCALENKINKEEIIAAIKPTAPIPAYIQANPYENFRPVVRVAHDHHDGCCDGRWA